MQIKFNIHPKYEETEIVICDKKMSDELVKLADTILKAVKKTLIAYAENDTVILRVSDILRVYAERQHVYAQTAEGVFQLHATLYETEQELDTGYFVRISKSELVNLRRVKRLDTSIAGTIRMYLEDGTETYVSRRNVSNIKKICNEQITKRGV